MAKKCILMLASRNSSPWTKIHDVIAIEVSGAGRDDIVEIHHREPEGASRDPLIIKGSKIQNVLLPRGQVRIARVKGDTPVTVFAHMKEVKC